MKNRTKTTSSLILIIITLRLITGCEGSQIFIQPNESEKLSVIGIIDADDKIRTLTFQKSFQPEYPAEEKDSLRELSFSLSSDSSILYEFSCNKSLRSDTKVSIPDSIIFETRKEYFLKASEKSVGVLSSQIIVPHLPPDFRVNSIEIKPYINSSYPDWAYPAMTATLHIIIKSFETDNEYLTFFIEGDNPFLTFPPTPKLYISYSVLGSDIPTFQEYLLDRTISFNCFTCSGRGGLSTSGSDDYSVSFFKMDKRNIEDINIFIGVEMGGRQRYDYKKPIRIKLLSIPEELFNFEKSIQTFISVGDDPFSEPVYLNSNIKNGYGIFAICRSKEITVSLPWE